MRKSLSKKGNQISKKIGYAIGTYNMIEDNDSILIGVSGGKDSLTLLDLLHTRQKFAPIKFKLHAAYIDTNLDKNSKKHISQLKTIFNKYDIPHTLKKIKVNFKKTRSHCFWCSWNRRKALFDLAEKKGCNKIALGHHKDDIIETVLLNLFFQGNISTMNPVQELFDGRISIIRPLVFCEERFITAYAQEKRFPKPAVSCPYTADQNRKYIKNLIARMQKRSPYIRDNIFKSLNRIRSDYIDLRDENHA